MSSTKRRVAVIGAGICGMFCMKHLKEEGIEPVCFEKSDKYAGTWYYRERSEYGHASLMPTTIINHSKESGAISDFPPRKEFSNHMKHRDVFQYFTEYLKHNDLEQYIRYETEVTSVKKADDYNVTGKWYVSAKYRNTEELTTETFEAVFIATGQINTPKMVHFQDQDTFSGKIMHTHSLKYVDEFAGQNVVVVGMGCSALDAAVEISRVSKQVYLSTRDGAFVLNRVGPHGYPMDYIMFRRYLIFLWEIFGSNFASWYLETFYLNKIFDQHLYNVKPKYHVLSKDPSVSDHIGHKLINGSIIQKHNIKHFTEKGVLFEEDERVTNVDSVIMATGYGTAYPFLEDGILDKSDGIIKLYKCMYPVDLPHPTLAFFGFFLPFGSLFPLAELQSRWAAYLLVGYDKLPSKEVMMKDVLKRHSNNVKRYAPSDKTNIRVDYVQYLDEIATEMGVKPNLLKYLFTDIVLFLKLLFGPSLPYQYRLCGHGKWEKARITIMASKKRVVWPLCKKNPLQEARILEYLASYFLNLLDFFHSKMI